MFSYTGKKNKQLQNNKVQKKNPVIKDAPVGNDVWILELRESLQHGPLCPSPCAVLWHTFLDAGDTWCLQQDLGTLFPITLWPKSLVLFHQCKHNRSVLGNRTWAGCVVLEWNKDTRFQGKSVFLYTECSNWSISSYCSQHTHVGAQSVHWSCHEQVRMLRWRSQSGCGFQFVVMWGLSWAGPKAGEHLFCGGDFLVFWSYKVCRKKRNIWAI